MEEMFREEDACLKKPKVPSVALREMLLTTRSSSEKFTLVLS